MYKTHRDASEFHEFCDGIFLQKLFSSINGRHTPVLNNVVVVAESARFVFGWLGKLHPPSVTSWQTYLEIVFNSFSCVCVYVCTCTRGEVMCACVYVLHAHVMIARGQCCIISLSLYTLCILFRQSLNSLNLKFMDFGRLVSQ